MTPCGLRVENEAFQPLHRHKSWVTDHLWTLEEMVGLIDMFVIITMNDFVDLNILRFIGDGDSVDVDVCGRRTIVLVLVEWRETI